MSSTNEIVNQVIDLLTEVEDTSGFIKPLLGAYSEVSRNDHYMGIDIYYSIPGLENVPFEQQGPLVRLFCAIKKAIYVSADSDAHRAGAYYDAIEQAKQGGYEAVFYDHLS